MNPPVPNPAQGNIVKQLTENLIQNTQVCINLGGTIITITEDKVRLAVHTHLSRMQLKRAWIGPLGILLTLGLALATAEFKDALLPAATWKAVYLLVGVASAVWFVREVWFAVRAPSVEDFVERLRASQVPLVSGPTALPSLTNEAWILYFNPPSGSKRITFEPDGRVGEGQNLNEHSWRITDDKKLELINADGRVFSRFSYNQAQDRWIHTNDLDTRSIRNQYIVRRNSC